jgi:hypothetical protein
VRRGGLAELDDPSPRDPDVAAADAVGAVGEGAAVADALASSFPAFAIELVAELAAAASLLVRKEGATSMESEDSGEFGALVRLGAFEG